MNLVAWMIVASEIAFWVVIVSGLIARYALKREKLGFVLLALTPVVDLVLLLITSIDLHRGAIATLPHALAAVYIGVSLAYGKSMIAWADERFKYYVVKQGPKPVRRYGKAYATHYLKSWFRHVVAYLIGSAFLVILIIWVNDPTRTESLTGALKLWTLVLGIDLLIAISNYIWPKQQKS